MTTNAPSLGTDDYLTALALSVRARVAWLLDGDRSSPCPAPLPRSPYGYRG